MAAQSGTAFVVDESHMVPSVTSDPQRDSRTVDTGLHSADRLP